MVFRIFNFKKFLFLNLLIIIGSTIWANGLINQVAYNRYPENLSNNILFNSSNNNSISIHPVQWNLVNYYDPLGFGQYTWRGDNFTGAWNLIQKFVKIKPGEGVVVAVIDTGYTPHPNIIHNLLLQDSDKKEYGYQFISDCRRAGTCPVNTPNSRATIMPKPDALDWGDYLTQEEIDGSNGYFAPCKSYIRNSSWHGTQMASIIAGHGNTQYPDISHIGGGYNAKIVPVRVGGKCGFIIPDLVDGILWAAGLHKKYINPNPAHIINMSLGGSGPCSKSLQNAINEVNSTTNTIIITSVGNNKENLLNQYPANCNGVMVVSAKEAENKLKYDSNFGSVTITASGGSKLPPCDRLFCGILVSKWGSFRKFSEKDNPVLMMSAGSSHAAAHVSAAVANIISVLKARGEKYDYERIRYILQRSSVGFTGNNGNCHEKGCVPDRVLDVGRAIELILEEDLRKDYIFFSSMNRLFTKHSLARCPAKISGNVYSILGGEDKCISYDINNAKVYALRYSYAKNYLLVGTDQGLYTCNIKSKECKLVPNTQNGISYISKPHVEGKGNEVYHAVARDNDNYYLKLVFKESNNFFTLINSTKNERRNGVGELLNDSINREGAFVTN